MVEKLKKTEAEGRNDPTAENRVEDAEQLRIQSALREFLYGDEDKGFQDLATELNPSLKHLH